MGDEEYPWGEIVSSDTIGKVDQTLPVVRQVRSKYFYVNKEASHIIGMCTALYCGARVDNKGD